MEEAFIAFGSNQGDSNKICLSAVEFLGRRSEIDVLDVSSLYLTRPVGPVEQPWFVNGVLRCLTALTVERLLAVLFEIENQFGRIRKERWGPRTLDLDLLFYGDKVRSAVELTVPHPRLHERLFVLAPLVEIAPECLHPCFQITAREMLRRLNGLAHGQEIVRLEAS